MKKVFKKSRHIRWNWERSPDDPEKVRYHFIDVDDKNRKGIMNRILQPLTKWGVVIPIRKDIEGNVKNSRLKYLFESFDSDQKPSMLDLIKLGKPVKRDFDLYERKRGDIENYVANLYELN